MSRPRCRSSSSSSSSRCCCCCFRCGFHCAAPRGFLSMFVATVILVAASSSPQSAEAHRPSTALLDARDDGPEGGGTGVASSRCPPVVDLFTDTQRYAVPVERLRSIRVWHAIQGTVHVKNSDQATGNVVIEVSKYIGGSRQQLQDIIITQDPASSSDPTVFTLRVAMNRETVDYMHVLAARIGRLLVDWITGGHVLAGALTASLIVLLIVVTTTVCVALAKRHRLRHQLPPRHQITTSTSTTLQTASSIDHNDDHESSWTIDGQIKNLSDIASSQNTYGTGREVKGQLGDVIVRPTSGGGGGCSGNGGGVFMATPGGRNTKCRMVHQATALIVCATAILSASAQLSADCLVEGHVDVTISLPQLVVLDDISLFFDEKFNNQVTVDLQKKSNGTSVKIFDLAADVLELGRLVPCGTVDGTSCRQHVVDPTETRVSCAVDGLSCYCTRGLVLHRHTCIDKDECESSQSAVCPPAAHCHNLNGSYECICPTGFYHDMTSHTCTACSASCPANHYEAVDCSVSRDRICTSCDVCGDSTVEVQPCLQTHNRKCTHVALPWLVVNNQLTNSSLQDIFSPVLPITQRRKRLRVDYQVDRIFPENLHSARQLETTYYVTNYVTEQRSRTTYYVTDSKQMTDFFWFRESGIRVNIGLQNVNVVPIYEDVDQSATGSDNEYFLASPSSPDDRDQFRAIVAENCRFPMPEQYRVTMEIAKDRTTKASVETCSEKAGSQASSHRAYLHEPYPCSHGAHPAGSQACPEGINVGDKFIRRTLNEPCQKMGSYPDTMKTAANSIVCTEGGALLRELFNVTPSVERPVSFPSKHCKSAIARCDLCTERDNCIMADVLESKCCLLNCYTMPECKMATSTQCENASVECAMGDSYRFTLQPVFASPRQEFRCHIRRRRPSVLYQVWFYVSVPGANFETLRVRTTARLDTGSDGVGRHVTEFLTVEHVSGLQQLHDELILVGRRNDATPNMPATGNAAAAAAAAWNFTVHPVLVVSQVELESTPWRKIESHAISNNIRVLTSQPDVPFAFSTSSWVTRGSSCGVDVKHFRSAGKLPTLGAQRVSAEIASIGGAGPSEKKGFEYRLKSTQNAPHLRFSIPGNTSVLRWWFRDRPSSLLMSDEFFQASLSLSEDGRLWHIIMAGQMSDCPGYLSITINDRSDGEELFRYDVMIACPSTFNLTFVVPSTGNRRTDKTFELIVDDAKHEYQLFLTYFRSDDDVRQPEVESGDPSVQAHAASMSTGASSGFAALGRGGDFLPAPLPLVVVSGCCLIVVVCLTARILCDVALRFPRSKFADKKQQPIVVVDQSGHPQLVDCSQKSTSPAGRRSVCRRRIVLVVVCFVFNLVYSLLFTFTAGLAVASAYFRSDLTVVMSAQSWLHDVARSATVDVQTAIETFIRDESNRRRRSIHSSRLACTSYLDDLAIAVRSETSAVSASGTTTRLHGRDDGGGSGISVSGVVDAIVNRTLARVEEAGLAMIEQLGNEVERRGRAKRRRQAEFFQRAINSGWTLYSRGLFNKTRAASASGSSSAPLTTADSWFDVDSAGGGELRLSHDEHRFLDEFLTARIADKILWYKPIFWNRFKESLASHSFVQRTQPGYCNGDTLRRKPELSPTLTNTTRFFASLSSVADATDDVTSVAATTVGDASLKLYDGESWLTVQLVLRCLDAIILLYRFSNTWYNLSRGLASSPAVTSSSSSAASSTDRKWSSAVDLTITGWIRNRRRSSTQRPPRQESSLLPPTTNNITTSTPSSQYRFPVPTHASNCFPVPVAATNCSSTLCDPSSSSFDGDVAIDDDDDDDFRFSVASVLRSSVVAKLVLFGALVVASYVILSTAECLIPAVNRKLLGSTESRGGDAWRPVRDDVESVDVNDASFGDFATNFLSHLSVLVNSLRTEIITYRRHSHFEACTMTSRVGHIVNVTSLCDVANPDVSSTWKTWKIPFVPCNVAVRFNSAASVDAAAAHSMTSLNDGVAARYDVIVNSARDVITGAVTAVLLTCAVLLAVDMLYSVLVRRLLVTSSRRRRPSPSDPRHGRPHAESYSNSGDGCGGGVDGGAAMPLGAAGGADGFAGGAVDSPRADGDECSEAERQLATELNTHLNAIAPTRDVIYFEFSGGFAETNV